VRVLTLGLSDGTRPGAALLVDAAEPLWCAGPMWAAAERVLSRAGVRADEVDQVALAGRYTPPLSVRRRPGSDRPADPFGLAGRWTAGRERMLRSTGLGAFDADKAKDWLEDRLRERGYRARRVTLVDRHQCLAAAAYRSQPSDGALVAVVLPRGDGAFATLHEGRAGQVERVWLDAASGPVHLWLDRARAAAGLTEPGGVEVLADGSASDPELARRLGETLRLERGRFVGRHLEVRSASPWSELGRLPRGVAAATIGDVFRRLALDWLARGLEQFPAQDLALGGVLAEDPRLVALAAELPGVRRVWAGPWTGSAALAPGAAMSAAGRAPALVAPTTDPGEGAPADLRAIPVDPDRVAAVLAEGAGVARYAAGGALDIAVLVRADRRDAVDRARGALQRPDGEPVGVLAPPGGLAVAAADRLGGPLRYGLAAPRVDDPQVAGVHRPDGRVRVGWADPALAEVLSALHARTGCGAVAVLPLGWGADPPVSDVGAAVAVWRRSGLPGLQVGSSWAERSAPEPA
jgi:predicted NodU family carbamoyl transferase